MNLTAAVKMRPPPVESDYKTRRETKNWKGHDLVSTAVRIEEANGKQYPASGGQLNPDWVEWLMRWPIGWTRLEPIEMDWRDWSVDPAETGEVPRITKNTPNKVARLKAIGNGQVPAAMALAWRVLMDDLRTALKL